MLHRSLFPHSHLLNQKCLLLARIVPETLICSKMKSTLETPHSVTTARMRWKIAWFRSYCMAGVPPLNHGQPMRNNAVTGVPHPTYGQHIRNYSTGTVPPPKYGQPVHTTHSHIVGENEITFGITKEEYRLRREKLAQAFSENGEGVDSLVIIPASERKYMIDKIPYFYRQDTDFRYFTGCLQPDCVLVIEISKDCSRSILFAKQNSEHEEKWEGCRIGLEEAVSFFGVDQSAPIQSVQKYLHQFHKDNPTSKIWYEFMEPQNQSLHKQIMEILQETNSFQNLSLPRPIFHSIRSIKSPSEVSLMRESAYLASRAIKETIPESMHLSTEAQINACIDYKCKMGGAEMMAYPAVVAAGNNANTIHYIANTDSLNNKNNMVLVDAGCELHGYSSDVTRTWPLGGKFTDPQKCVYEAVLDTQEKLIRRISSGTVSIDGLYSVMLDILSNNLIEVGLISSKTDKLKVSRATRQFCPHHVSHYLGMDVHDTPTVSKCVDLTPGMVLTVEPGIYIPSTNHNVEDCFRGIGVRIEDDVLVTSEGCEVLSSQCPKSVMEIEELCAGGSLREPHLTH